MVAIRCKHNADQLLFKTTRRTKTKHSTESSMRKSRLPSKWRTFDCERATVIKACGVTADILASTLPIYRLIMLLMLRNLDGKIDPLDAITSSMQRLSVETHTTGLRAEAPACSFVSHEPQSLAICLAETRTCDCFVPTQKGSHAELLLRCCPYL